MSALGVILYDYPGSICCQMTRLTLVEKGVACVGAPVGTADGFVQTVFGRFGHRIV